MINVGVVGATGYTGQELVKLLAAHPSVNIRYLLCRNDAGKRYSTLFPAFTGMVDNVLQSEQALQLAAEECDVLFLALPHGVAAKLVTEELLHQVKVIDLGADFRIKDPLVYDRWYGLVHPAPHLLRHATYGLTEWNRKQIANARLVANPGCYATSILLALLPLVVKGVGSASIIVDAKSGVSGAGRVADLSFNFNECHDSLKAYKVTAHRHTPEVEQELCSSSGQRVKLTFTPHLVPMKRGILATSYVQLPSNFSHQDLVSIYNERYANEAFVRLIDTESPETRWAQGTNNCFISLNVDERTGYAVIVSALDNLVKGAAGQAVQNMNLMFRINESDGLTVNSKNGNRALTYSAGMPV